MTPAAKLAYFLQRSVVRGKVVRAEYFQEQGLEVFLEKLRAQGWLSLFSNTQMGCSVSELAEFYANCCLLYTSPSPRDGLLSRMPSSA